MTVERKKREREKVNDYSGTIVSERRRWRTHTLGPKEEEKKSMIIVIPSCLKDADGARTRSDQNSEEISTVALLSPACFCLFLSPTINLSLFILGVHHVNKTNELATTLKS